MANRSKAVHTILYIHSSDEMYGADLILLQIVTRLDPSQFRPIVIVPTDLPYDGKLSQALQLQGVKTIPLQLAVLRRSYFSPLGLLIYGWRFIYSLWSLLLIISREGVDIVHSNTLSVIPGAIAAKLMRKPHVWHVHEIIVKPKLLWRVTAWLAGSLADQVVAVSTPTYEHLCRGSQRNLGKASVIYNGIDTKRFSDGQGAGPIIRQEWQVGIEHTVVGMVGRISHWKGQEYFLEIAHRLASAHPYAKFVMVGGIVPGQGELRDHLLAEIRRRNLEDQVILNDFRTDIPAVLDAYDVFVLPSILPDPFPTTLLEAMAMAKPVVANAHGGAIEMIEHGVTGFLVQPNDPTAMEQAIALLLQDADRRKYMGEQGKRRLERKFSLDSFIQQWTNLYVKLAA